MAVYIAHYRSPQNENPTSGSFEFESEHRAGSKQNLRDARMHMLVTYGNEAVTWNIDDVQVKRAKSDVLDNQIEIDFREPVKHRKTRTVNRGRL